MSDEPKTDGGVLGKARRLADQVGEYAKSDEAREKFDALKKRAAQAVGMATAGAKKVAESTKRAAAQAKEKADEFSKSEQVQAFKARAKEDWDEFQGGSFRGSKLSDSPVVIGLAIVFIFPLGLYLLWKHPILGRNKRWWWAGGVWGVLYGLTLIGFVEDMRGVGKDGARVATSPPDDGRLAAEYLPHNPGAVREYINEVSVADGTLMRFRRREVDGDDGMIEITNALTGGSQGGRDLSVGVCPSIAFDP